MKRGQISDLLKKPLDELGVSILSHSDPSLSGYSGTILSETRNMMEIRLISSRTILVPKKYGLYQLVSSQGRFTIKGQLLEGNAKRRSKRKMRHW